jgi:hypothetical protein
MFADPKKNASRRLKRQLKAGASIVLAMAAGAFLACQKESTPGASAGPNQGGPDAREPPAPPVAPVASSTALVVVDGGGTDPDAGKRPQVDRKEHRSGMPVRDNLLE